MATVAILLLCGVLGLLLCGMLAIACVEWYRISSFEGYSGYFVAGMALIGGIAALVLGAATLGVVNFADAGPTGQWLAPPLAVLVAVGIAWAIARWQAEPSPKLRGERFQLQLDFESPCDWVPSVSVMNGDNTLILWKLDAQQSGEQDSRWPIPWESFRQEADRWYCRVDIEPPAGRNDWLASICCAAESVPPLPLQLPKRYTADEEIWSDWFPPLHDRERSQGWRHRYRARKLSDIARDAQQILSDLREAQQRRFAALRPDSPMSLWAEFFDPTCESSCVYQAGLVVRERPAELLELIESGTLPMATLAMRGLVYLYPRPATTAQALEYCLDRVVDDCRKLNLATRTPPEIKKVARELLTAYDLWRSERRLCGGPTGDLAGSALVKLQAWLRSLQFPEGVNAPDSLRALMEIVDEDLQQATGAPDDADPQA